MPTQNLRTTKLATPETEVAIAGIDCPVILTYFESLNAEQYDRTAALFAHDGVLYPPFEQGIVGPDAIVDYLTTEAKGMRLHPHESLVKTIDSDGEVATQIQVAGKVQTPLFGVNVRWTFILNPADQITSVKVRLLASPQELINLR